MQSVTSILARTLVAPNVQISIAGGVNMQVRGYMRGFRGKPRVYKSVLKPKKEPKIDPKFYNPEFNEPISGSVIHGDMAEIREKGREFAGDIESLTARGFLRFQKPYEPPADAEERFLDVVRALSPNFEKMSANELKKVELKDSRLKYDVLSKAASEFDHSVPNSMLPGILTIGNAVKFYKTPIRTTTPFDELVRSPDLPPNLYIQKEPFRFTDETVHLHGGVTAFPKSSTIVTGLRAKQKYKGYKAKQSWP